jgi:hypothetical protein
MSQKVYGAVGGRPIRVMSEHASIRKSYATFSRCRIFRGGGLYGRGARTNSGPSHKPLAALASFAVARRFGCLYLVCRAQAAGEERMIK